MAKTLPKWARVRQLIDGSYVAEVRVGSWPFRSWRAVHRNGLLAKRGDSIPNCIVSQPEDAIKSLANCGVSLVDDGRPEAIATDESPGLLKHTAFITGSHFYGSPTEDSDVDLAILCSLATEEKLKELSDDKRLPIRFGKLNIITLRTQGEYDAWLAARARLASMPGNTKETRISIHKEELRKRTCAHRPGVSS